MSDRIVGYEGRLGKFAILVEISGKMTPSVAEGLLAEARRVGLSARVVWSKKKTKRKAKKKAKRKAKKK